jgi:hypothetical protein
MTARAQFGEAFRKRWFWLLLLAVAVLGLAVGILFPVTSRAPM